MPADLHAQHQAGLPVVSVDEKWSIAYDPSNNDKPVYWLRHGERHSQFDGPNPVFAMFYALLKWEQHHLEGGEGR